MPEFPGTLRTPRRSAAPSSPALGELYYDTDDNVLYWWNGTSWVAARGDAADPPGTELAYVQRTTDVTITAGTNTEASPLTLLTLPATDFDGSIVIAEFGFVEAEMVTSAAENQVGVNLWDETTNLGRLWRHYTPTVSGPGKAVPAPFGRYRFTSPSASGKVYRLRGWAITNNAVLRAGSGGADELPGWFRIVKV
jgi:hypothetical protein